MKNALLSAKELLSRRTSHMTHPCLELSLRPKTLNDALNIQDSMIDLNTDKVGGWKCLLPLAEDKFVVAPIFSQTIQRGEHCSLFADNDKARIEPEIAFILGKDLPASEVGYSEEEINEAIGSCHMALELMQARYSANAGAEFYDVLADCLTNQGMFIGPEISREKAFNASEFIVSISQEEHEHSFDGKHPNSSAQAPIYWLINYMTRRGTTFFKGEAIITGSYCGIVELDFDIPTSVKYEGVGEYQVTFSKKS